MTTLAGRLLDIVERVTEPRPTDEAAPPEPLITVRDLTRRWGMSRQGVHWLRENDERFPRAREITYGDGVIIVWAVRQIEHYEQATGRQPVEPGDTPDEAPENQPVDRSTPSGPEPS